MIYGSNHTLQSPSSCPFPAELPVAAPLSPAQNPTKAHLGPCALLLHTNSSLLPALATGPCCLLRSPSNEHPAAPLFPPLGSFSSGLSLRGRGQLADSSHGGYGTHTWQGHGRQEDGTNLYCPHSGPAPSSACGALALATLTFS